MLLQLVCFGLFNLSQYIITIEINGVCGKSFFVQLTNKCWRIKKAHSSRKWYYSRKVQVLHICTVRVPSLNRFCSIAVNHSAVSISESSWSYVPNPQNIATSVFLFPKQGQKRVKELCRQKPWERKRDQINKLMPVLWETNPLIFISNEDRNWLPY